MELDDLDRPPLLAAREEPDLDFTLHRLAVTGLALLVLLVACGWLGPIGPDLYLLAAPVMAFAMLRGAIPSSAHGPLAAAGTLLVLLVLIRL